MRNYLKMKKSHLCSNVYSAALEWLIARQSDDLTDKKIPTIPKSNSISSPSGIISNDVKYILRRAKFINNLSRLCG